MMWWMLAMLFVAAAAWAMAELLLVRRWRNGARHEDLYCAYCFWGLSRTSNYEVYHWEGHVYCSLVCLRHGAELQERVRGLG